MTNKYVLDTHTLLWYLEGNTKLSSTVKTIIDHPNSELILPAIALAEAMFIVEKGKVQIPNVNALLSDIDNDPRIQLHTLDRQVMDKTLVLQEIPEMHDRQIAATALVLVDLGYTVHLLTKDEILVASNSVSTIW